MILAFVAIVAAWTALEAAWTVPEVPARGTLALPTGLILLATHGAAIAEHVATGRSLPMGSILLVGGVALRLWAIRALGDAFATALAPKCIVTHGPYRWLRHPSEIGLVAAAFGGALMLGSVVGLAGASLLVPLSIVRGQREMRAMPPS